MFKLLHHQKQIDELRRDVDQARKSYERLELEWCDMYDRMKRTLMKISKREQRLEHAEGPGGVEESPTSDSPSTLSGRAADVQARILARRRGGNGGLLPR